MDKQLKQQIIDRMTALAGLIEKCNYEYYILSKPTLSDFEYDMYYKELEKIEQKYPELKFKDSPTNKVGAIDHKENKFKKTKHIIPMLSLENTYNNDDIAKFVKNTNVTEFFIEPKYDGASLSLIYEKGKLVKAISRGDGKTGEDITDNVMKINNIPKQINILTNNFELRGEAVMFHKDFDALNIERKANNKEEFSNCRNAASGMLRLKDNSEVKGLSFMAYLIPTQIALAMGLNTQQDISNKLIELGFTTGQCYFVDEYIKIKTILDKIQSSAKQMEYDIDGAVIKVNDLNKQNELGNATKYPKWAVAFKYPQNKVYTKLKSVTYQVGKLGTITPVAELEPIEIDGSIIARASLHNFDEIKRLGIKIGDQVAVEKAAAIIPKISGFATELRTGEEKEIEIPDTCPICNSILVKKEGEVAIKCTDFKCPGRMKGLIKSFVGKEGLDIEGFGESNVELFYDTGLIKKPSDIFELINKEQELLYLPKFAKKKVDNLIAAIKNCINVEPHKAVYALQIEMVGNTASELLIDYYGNFDNVITAKTEQLSSIDGIGEICANSIIKTVQTEYFKELYSAMKKFGIKFEKEKIEASNQNLKLSGMKICVTGTLSQPRQKIHSLISANGGVVKDSVTKDLDYLIVGENCGSKIDKAMQYGINILSEQELIKMLK